MVTAACLHATWNLLAKRAGGGVAFVWLVSLLAAVLYAPLALAYWALQAPTVGPREVLFTAVSAALHTVYFLLLQAGYRRGDLSLVYPLARGTGPLLSTTLAVALLGERPSPLALSGALLVVIGVFVLTGGAGARSHSQAHAVLFGVATGVVIAAYTLWDKHVVSGLGLAPLLFDWMNNAGRALLLTPAALPRRSEVAEAWRRHRWEAFGVALLSPLSYILVLTAMVFTPVSYVAPAREISILIGTAMGARRLAEGHLRRRLLGAGAMVAGLAALVLG